MSVIRSLLLTYAVGFSYAGPIGPRTVTSLDEAAFEEAQQRDDTATRAFSNVQIKTSDGKCLFVDELSGDFRANLTPIQVGTCGATDGQGWDIITKGKHDDQAGTMLVVSTLTQACMNFDPRRAAGNQVNLFSCGGRADGGGQVTNSQLFNFTGGAGPFSLQPTNAAGSCFIVKGNALDVAQCSSSDATQSFTIGGGAGDNVGTANGETSTSSSTAQTATDPATTTAAGPAATTSAQETGETTANGAQGGSTTAPVDLATEVSSSTEIAVTSTSIHSSSSTSTPSPSDTVETTASTSAAATGDSATANPTEPVPVSRAGGVLNPTAAAEANQRDDTATRAFSDVEIRAPNGQCLSVDPTAGDFRENLIPVALVDCAGSAGEKWDVITAGKHNDAQGAALIVSSLTQGCISLDTRRPAGDTVTLFSCGGRADGGGGTNTGQLIPFIGALSFPFAPVSENNQTCILAGNAGRLDSGPCPSELGPQLFSIFPE